MARLFFLLINYFLKKKKNLSIVNLQCCVCFKCLLHVCFKQRDSVDTYLYICFFRFFSHVGYYKMLSRSSLCYTVGRCCLSLLYTAVYICSGFPGGSVVEIPPANAGDMGSIPGWGRFPGVGK